MTIDEDASEAISAGAQPGTSRREFMLWTGAAVGGTALVAALGRVGEDPELLENLAERVAPNITTDPFGTTIVARRPGDQCVLTLSFFNMHPDLTQSPPVLFKIQNTIECGLIVEFGALNAVTPMHIAEHAFPLVSAHLDPSAQADAPTPVPASTAPVKAPPVGSRISGGSRLVFKIPDELVPLPIDTEHLLDWVGLPLIVVPNAVPPFHPLTSTSPIPAGIGAPREPFGTETAIELPYNLVISPPASPVFNAVGPFAPTTVFVNSTTPVTHDGWTELWHTRLAARRLKFVGDFGFLAVDETQRDLRTVRAIWCKDATFADDLAANKSDNQIVDDHDPNFTTSLTYDDRYDIVRLSSDFTLDSKGGPFRRKASTDPITAFGYVPSPATVDRLVLTSLGGWLDCDAHWDLIASAKRKHFNTSLLSWRQRTVQGRDSYVRVVRKGYLFPWGHRASLVTVTEREFTVEGGAVGAYLRQKTFIVVTAPVKDYGGSGDFAPFSGRHIPFTSVEALTIVTPDLASPGKYITALQNGTPIQANAETVFEPMIGPDTPFLFHFRGTDWAGDLIDLRTPVLWVDDTAAYGTNGSTPLMDAVIDKWRGTNPVGPYPSINLHNQRVSVATPKEPTKATGDTQVVLASFELGVDRPDGASAQNLIDASQPIFYPSGHTMSVNLPQAATASGHSVDPTSMQFEPGHYLANGFLGNKGGVFLQRTPATTRNMITFNSAKAGGAVTPNLGIDGISREIGPVSGASISNLADGTFDPADVFDGVDAKLLGGLDLTTILGLVTFGKGDPNGNSRALQLTSVERQNPHRIVTLLDWHPTLKAGGPTVGTEELTVFVPTGGVLDDQGNTLDSMDLHAVIITDLDNPANSTSTIVGQIRNFELDLFGNSGDEYFIQIPFDSLTFRAQTGKKTDVDVQVSAGGVQFQGALSFVQDLASFLNFAGSGLTIDTSGSAITATLTLAIPTIAVGIFSLANLAFSAGVAIPYNGDPVRFTFAFCSAENPFQLTIMIFTGGGFIEIGIGPDGVEMLSFSFDFGLGFSIDIGIASGQVSLTGGVYYESEKLDDGGQSIDLTAWVKASGGVSALGIVSVSVELYLGLGYQSDGPGTAKLVGDAEMSISVHIIFFGFTIGFDIHEEFDVSSSDTPAVAAPHNTSRKKKAITAAPDAEPPPKPDTNLFGTSMTQENWEAYCTSFAVIGVGA